MLDRCCRLLQYTTGLTSITYHLNPAAAPKQTISVDQDRCRVLSIAFSLAHSPRCVIIPHYDVAAGTRCCRPLPSSKLEQHYDRDTTHSVPQRGHRRRKDRLLPPVIPIRARSVYGEHRQLSTPPDCHATKGGNRLPAHLHQAELVQQYGSEDGSGEETVHLWAPTRAESPGSAATGATSHGRTHTRFQCQAVPSRECKLMHTLRETFPAIAVRSSRCCSWSTVN